MPRAYLDHASTSPLRPVALEAMLPWLSGVAADPGRVHTEGRMTRVAVEDARSAVAALLGCRSSREVVFTSGATESIAAAVFGATGGGATDATVVCAAVEHSAVRETSARSQVVEVPVDGFGVLDVDAVRAAVSSTAARPVLVHCQWGNHEVGTLQPVREVVELCRSAGVLVHVDAAQAAGRVPIDFASLGADLLSISAHKMGGPAGVGALLVRRGLRVEPLLVGGDQERARRAGMESVAAVVGWGAVAGSLTSDVVDEERARSERLTQRVLDWATATDGVTTLGHPTARLPHIACLGIDGVEAEPVLLGLDQAGIAAHSGSSCSTESLEPSPVLEAMGVEAERSLRISTGWSSTDADIDLLLSSLPDVLERLRSLRT